MNNENLYFVDFVILRVIHESGQLTQKQLVGLSGKWDGEINRWLSDNEMNDIRYGKPKLRSIDVFVKSIVKWRELGYCEEGIYAPVRVKTTQLFRRVGDDWHKWPAEVPFTETGIRWNQAIYITEE